MAYGLIESLVKFRQGNMEFTLTELDNKRYTPSLYKANIKDK
jgi:hypothetical protein